MTVALETAKRLTRLYNILARENKSDTHSLRFVLWAIHTGRIPSAKVYVDQWPSFSHVCCIYNSNLYSKGTDRDFIALTTADEKGSSFVEFFQRLAKERRWKERQGAIFCHIPTSLARTVEKLLLPSPSDGRVEMFQPYRHLDTEGPEELSEVQNEVQRVSGKLPVGWTIDSLREEEATAAADCWSLSIPDKEDYFKWLVKTYPSACVRDQHDRPIGWQLTMSFVTAGAAFVHPEHRGLDLDRISATALIAKILKIYPGYRFAGARDSNSASLRSISKLPWKYNPTDLLITWLIYHSPTLTNSVMQKSSSNVLHVSP